MTYQLLNINFLIIFGFILAQGYLGWMVDATDDRAGKYRTLILAQTWLPTYCHSKEKTGLTKFCQVVDNYERWSIHGLWPIGIENCDNTLLNLNEINNEKSSLKQAWVDVYDLNNNNGYEHNGKCRLWENEWIKHGTCAFDKKEKDPQKKYFSLALSYYTKNNLQSVLAQKNIIPNNDKAYRWQEITDALKAHYELETFKLYCRFNDAEDKQYLLEIRVCFDKNQDPMKCGKAQTTQGLCIRPMDIIIPVGKSEEANNANSKPSYTRTNSRDPGAGTQGNTRGYGSKGAPSRADLSYNWRSRA